MVFSTSNREEQVEEVDENLSSLISIGGFILGLVVFTFGISYLIAYRGGFLVFAIDNNLLRSLIS